MSVTDLSSNDVMRLICAFLYLLVIIDSRTVKSSRRCHISEGVEEKINDARMRNENICLFLV